MGGSGGRVVAALPCPGCGCEVRVVHRPTYNQGWAQQQILWFSCTKCSPTPIHIDARIEGLPSDTSFLEANWKRLAGKALASERRKRRRELAVKRRAENLLKQYLNGWQRRTYDSQRLIRVPSRRIPGLRYEINETQVGAHATALLDPKVRASFSPPGLSESVIRKHRRGLSVARIPLCLHPTGALSPPDQTLALKLLLDADEASAWKKGSRLLRGLPPERIA
jgi:hypothetical protein